MYNVRESILMELSNLIREDSQKWPATRKISISNENNENLFDEYDLPIAHVVMGEEAVDEHVLCDPLLDIRESLLTIDIYIDKYISNDGPKLYIDQSPDDLKMGIAYIERISSSVSVLMQQYQGDRSILDIKLSTLTFTIEAKSNPKVGKLHMVYQCRYQVDLNRDA